MQDMFLSKFKKLKQKNKVLFNKAMKKPSKTTESAPDEEAAVESTNCAIPTNLTTEENSDVAGGCSKTTTTRENSSQPVKVED